MAVPQWAQTWYGIWRFSLSRALQHFDDPKPALG